ncbi:MAG: cysteine ABC transporter substrate-binding protein [Bacillaceae bacterium]|jgi:L-cystine transport system substrate-binding protein|uniref:Cysteine ABC transporter substrate-binding protein n=2 Tax=Aeribacillus TaxID=1055323 RepID=A0A165Y136_9BACI|nr:MULTISPECIES: transporter substrate-binding domain-containing protein [Aeribacillus]AXI38340.1 cysteine ABC transporter substrate-binding protein [Bacillaceae bacterium ZC4]REJ17745.1 MAG: cysteine ABC transporter substrate-binding protein [Bacillaceae bacterium]ASS89057.1 cysteine ABC transporter substrate-binding protein [Aeribacillus pallidus]KZM54557.1 cysteine ABC transporter substrate-binding protein [Aeribacillus pallidus]KZN96616.1 cysteine ABC transporter substrate-binding protein 
MKKIRWFISLIAIAALILSACGNNNDQKEKQTQDQEKNALQEIKDKGEITVGIMGTYAPYNFMNENKEYDGFDVDIAKELAKRLGVKANFVAQEFSGLIPGLQKGKFDILVSQVTITDERKKQIDFTEPYITNKVKVIVREDNNDIKSVNDFKGKTIGVGLGTNDEAYLRNELLPKVGDFKINTYDDVITTLKDLDAGRIDATINNVYALKPVIEENGYKIKAVGDPIKEDQAGVAVKKGNKELVDALNKALKEMKEDGTYKEIYVKWFDEEPTEE